MKVVNGDGQHTARIMKHLTWLLLSELPLPDFERQAEHSAAEQSRSTVAFLQLARGSCMRTKQSGAQAAVARSDIGPVSGLNA